MSMYYRLDAEHKAVPVEDVKQTDWSEKARRIGFSVTPFGRVSTVFLVLNHAHDDGPPVLFETMMFGGSLDEEQIRYRTWDEAVAGHRRAVAAAWFAPLMWLWRKVGDLWRKL